MYLLPNHNVMSVRVPTLFDDFFDDEEDKKREEHPDVKPDSPLHSKEKVEGQPTRNASTEDVNNDLDQSPSPQSKAPEEEKNLTHNADLDKLDKQIRLELPYDLSQASSANKSSKSAIIFESAEPESEFTKEIAIGNSIETPQEDQEIGRPQIEGEAVGNSPSLEQKEEVDQTTHPKEDSDEEQDTAALEDTAPTIKEPIEPSELNKRYYGISAVAEMFGLSVSNIRFWTIEFNLKPRTNKKGDRLYTPEQIEKIRLIYNLVKVQHHTIKGAKVQLSKNKKSVRAQVDLKDQLLALKSNLEQLRNQLYDSP